MGVVLVDTCVLVDLWRGTDAATGYWRRLEDIAQPVISAVTVAELLAGCRNRAEQLRVA